MQIFVMLTQDIIHPETQETIVSEGSIITPEFYQYLHDDLGLDSIIGYACTSYVSAARIRRQNKPFHSATT
jgi:hypothetical protein